MTTPEPDRIDEASAESFPASDPPSWEPLHSGAPDAHPNSARDDHTRFVGSVPEAYDRYLGPLLFEPFARDLVQRLDLPKNARVLELACGTGRLTRHLRLHLAPNGHVTATDLNGPMLTTAMSTVGVGPDIEWRQADATALPFNDASFDAVVCQFGIMFFPDKPAAVREALRVLEPGGEFLFNVWDSFDHNPLARLAEFTIDAAFTSKPPEFYSTPYGMYDAAAIEALLVAAGFQDVVVETVSLTTEAPSARDAATGFVHGNPVALTITERGVDVERIVNMLAEAYRRELGDRPLRAPIRAKVVSGRRPAGGR
jgi:ubiquinone/menaquinone biosynthesis C-methylase UbiE